MQKYFLYALTTTISILLCSKADASFCNNFNNLAYVAISDDMGENPINCQDLQQFDDFLGHASSYTVQPIPRLHLIVTSEEVPGGANYNEDHELIEMQILKNKPESREPMMQVFAHEVGHGVFQKYLNSRIQVLGEQATLVEQYKEAFTRQLPEFIPFYTDPTCNTDGTDCNNRYREWANSSPLFQDSHRARERKSTFEESNHDRLEEIDSKVEHYHELFADLFASVIYNNPNVNIESVGYLFPGTDQSCRSFNTQYPANFASDSAYCKLSLIRSLLWANIDFTNIETQKASLDRIAQILADLAEFEINVRPLSVNEQIQRIRQALGTSEAISTQHSPAILNDSQGNNAIAQ